MKKETAVSCKTAGEVPEEVSIYNTIIPQPALEDSSCARHTRLLDTFSIEKHDSRSSCTLMGREWSSAPPGLSPGLQVYPQTDTLLNIYLIKRIVYRLGGIAGSYRLHQERGTENLCPKR
ncbi:MAG TPA: hypothetical protein PK411_13855 [Mesotoga infera]|nr:hypothetical protein [Mesotoga infera]HRV02688.1 hypothetical protein [Mesotoga sp.]